MLDDDPTYGGEYQTPEEIDAKMYELQELEQSLSTKLEVALRKAMVFDFVSGESTVRAAISAPVYWQYSVIACENRTASVSGSARPSDAPAMRFVSSSRRRSRTIWKSCENFIDYASRRCPSALTARMPSISRPLGVSSIGSVTERSTMPRPRSAADRKSVV